MLWVKNDTMGIPPTNRKRVVFGKNGKSPELLELEAELSDIMNKYTDLQDEIVLLNENITTLTTENTDLRKQLTKRCGLFGRLFGGHNG